MAGPKKTKKQLAAMFARRGIASGRVPLKREPSLKSNEQIFLGFKKSKELSDTDLKRLVIRRKISLEMEGVDSDRAGDMATMQVADELRSLQTKQPI